jgi:hypothetical protein
MLVERRRDTRAALRLMRKLLKKREHERERAPMKTLFLGDFASAVAPRILSKVKTPLETQILKNEGDAERVPALLADAEIIVGHIWRAGFPPAPRLRLLQSVAAGLNLLDTDALPKGVTVCNVRQLFPQVRSRRPGRGLNRRPDPR